MDKFNCWEFKKCGHGPFSRTDNRGACPAVLDARFHGSHGETNAGRACWVVAETLCHGKHQGTFMQKHRECSSCEFYGYVKTVEGREFQLTVLLLKLET